MGNQKSCTDIKGADNTVPKNKIGADYTVVKVE